MMEQKNLQIKVLILIGIIGLIFSNTLFSQETIMGENSAFKITDVRALSRNGRDGSISVIYAAVNSKNPEMLPVLDVYYTVQDGSMVSPALSEKTFNTVPMISLDSELQSTSEEGLKNHLYRAEIPPQKAGLVVEYFILAKVPGGQEMVYPKNAPLSLQSFRITKSRINRFHRELTE